MPPSSPRIGAGAVTMSACAEFAAPAGPLTAASRATMRNLRAPAQPPPAFGAPDALPARASRAALSASAGSFLSRPAILFPRLGPTASTTSQPSSASLLEIPAPCGPVPSTPTTTQSRGSPIAAAIRSYPSPSAAYAPVATTRPTRSITHSACVSLWVSIPAATVPLSFILLLSSGARRPSGGQTRHWRERYNADAALRPRPCSYQVMAGPRVAGTARGDSNQRQPSGVGRKTSHRAVPATQVTLLWPEEKKKGEPIDDYQ